MPTCRQCGKQLDVEDLVRHEHADLLMVHCPNCHFVLGVYNQHSKPPETDLLRG